jgi:hypothetical protein
MASCYVFNQGIDDLAWTLNGTAMPLIAGTSVAYLYAPDAGVAQICKHTDDAPGAFAFEDANHLVLTFPGVVPVKRFAYDIAVPPGVSIDDDLILCCLRQELILLNPAGFVLKQQSPQPDRSGGSMSSKE